MGTAGSRRNRAEGPTAGAVAGAEGSKEAASRVEERAAAMLGSELQRLRLHDVVPEPRPRRDSQGQDARAAHLWRASAQAQRAQRAATRREEERRRGRGEGGGGEEGRRSGMGGREGARQGQCPVLQ